MHIPAATVCPMSRMANLPRGGNSLAVSTTMGLVGSSLTTAMSPVLRKSGWSALTWPDLGSMVLISSTNLQAVWVVWQWNTGVYPTVMTEGWFRTTICAVKVLATDGGLSTGPATSPLLTSFFATPRTLNPTLSPGTAWGSCSWCISMDLTSPGTWEGSNMTFMLGLRTPVSTRPTGTVPIPVMV